MAIIVVCKKCKGTGKVEESRFILFNVKVKCPICCGKRKVDISTLNSTRNF